MDGSDQTSKKRIELLMPISEDTVDKESYEKLRHNRELWHQLLLSTKQNKGNSQLRDATIEHALAFFPCVGDLSEAREIVMALEKLVEHFPEGDLRDLFIIWFDNDTVADVRWWSFFSLHLKLMHKAPIAYQKVCRAFIRNGGVYLSATQISTQFPIRPFSDFSKWCLSRYFKKQEYFTVNPPTSST